jgi:CRP/FNR family transcriptional regulator
VTQQARTTEFGATPFQQLPMQETYASSVQFGANTSSTRVLQRGEHVFRVNDPCRSLYVVHSGAVKTVMTSRAGDEQIIDFFMPGDVLGLDALAQGKYACNAIALGTVAIRVFPVDRLGSASSQANELSLLKELSGQLARHHNLLLLMGHKNAEQKIASFLLDQSERHAERGFSPIHFTLPMPRADIARYLGLAAETASRVFTRLQTKGVLAVERNEIQILDQERLAWLADSDHDEHARQVH